MTQKHEKTAKSKGNGQICAILSYLLIGLIWYALDKEVQKDSFVKFHVKQGLVLLVVTIIYNIVLGILFSLLFFGMLGMLWWILHLLYYVPLIFMIIGILNAVNMKENELPVIGHYAKKLTF